MSFPRLEPLSRMLPSGERQWLINACVPPNDDGTGSANIDRLRERPWADLNRKLMFSQLSARCRTTQHQLIYKVPTAGRYSEAIQRSFKDAWERLPEDFKVGSKLRMLFG